jgi:hypothetical protein
MHTEARAPLDRRAASRHRVLHTGKLVFGDRFTVDCAIRDRSDDGVRVRTSKDLLPRKLTLVAVGEGKAYTGEIVWRRGDQAGLRLTEAQDLGGQVEKGLRHARAIWAENALRDFTPELEKAVIGESLD